MSIHTSDFDRLVFKTLAAEGHHAFLIVLLNAQTIDADRTAFQVSGSLIANCVKGFDFDLFKRDMKSNNLSWDLALIRVANVVDGSTPYLNACQQELARMEQGLLHGDIVGLSVFDKKGQLFQGLRSQRRDFSDTSMFAAAVHVGAAPTIQPVRFDTPVADFDSLIANMKKQPGHNTALISLVKVEGVSDASRPGSMIGVAAQTAYPCDETLNLAHIIETSRRDDVDWDVMCVVMANNKDGSPASDVQCTTYLRDISERLTRGDLGGFTFFDNLGRPIEAIPAPDSGPVGRPPRMH